MWWDISQRQKRGFRFLLTCICMASQWPEIVTLKSVTAKSVAQGVRVIEQGPQFIGKLMARWYEALGMDKIKTTPYRPECNGTIECMHRTLSSMLRKTAQRRLD